MAIYKYTEKDGKEYWRVYVHARSAVNRTIRVQRSKFKIETKAQARREEKRLLQVVITQVAKNDCKGNHWGDIVHLWHQDMKRGLMGDISPRSVEGYISILRHWTKSWNFRPAADIGRADGRALVKSMGDAGRSRRYIKKVINLIDKVYLWGIEEGRIYGTEPPCKKINLGKIESKTPEVLSLEEIKKFLNAAQVTDNQWYPIWAMALLTGMRSGELHALSWDQIDFGKKTIIVDRSYDSNTKKTGPTKGRYWRTVPISSDLHNLLIDIQSNLKVEGGYVLPRLKEWENGDQAVSLRNFLKSIGLKDVKFHALRACWATQMLASGVPAAIVMKIGGWKKMATLDIYVRLAGVEIQGATDCLNFVPDKIDYSENVVDFASFKGSTS